MNPILTNRFTGLYFESGTEWRNGEFQIDDHGETYYTEAVEITLMSTTILPVKVYFELNDLGKPKVTAIQGYEWDEGALSPRYHPSSSHLQLPGTHLAT